MQGQRPWARVRGRAERLPERGLFVSNDPNPNPPSRRRSPRRRITARLHVASEQDGSPFYDLVDISDVGCCLSGPEPFEAGRKLEITLSWGEAEAVLTAEVVWTRPSGRRGFRIGCAFEPKNRKSEEWLRRLLEQLPIIDEAPSGEDRG